jgi:hypothetical protein
LTVSALNSGLNFRRARLAIVDIYTPPQVSTKQGDAHGVVWSW